MRVTKAAVVLLCITVTPALAQDTSAVRHVGDSLSIRFVDADIRGVIQTLGRYLPKPVLVGTIPPTRVSLETPAPVPRSAVRELLKSLVESQSLDFSEDSTFSRISSAPPRPAQSPVGAGSTTGVPLAVQLFVIRLKHARAADVAATVNLLFGAGGEFSGRNGLSTPTLSDELRRNVIPPAGAALPNAAAPSATPTKTATLTGAVTIVPDELTNALLIRASAADYAVLEQAVSQLDIRPLQALIEVMIVEARRDRSFSFGADLFLPPQSVDHGTGTVDASSVGAGLGDLVIHLMNVGHAQIDATLRAAASKGDVQICLLYTSPSPRDLSTSRMPSSA